jgi:hypothetical protein
MPNTQTIPIGTDRQLFVDDLIVDQLDKVQLKLHPPTPRETCLRLDQPWEGTTSWCPVVFRDTDRYRMWYRAQEENDHCFTAYAESTDGIHWERPALGQTTFNDSSANNICIDHSDIKNVAVFRDDNASAPADARYKAVGRSTGGRPARINSMVSADGIHWRLAQDGPLIVAPEDDPQFDSPLSAFWDVRRQCYAIYVRGWCPDGAERRIRAIRFTTSTDFIHWEPWQYTKIIDAAQWPWHLYTNAAHPYHRAPIYLMFPKRFLPERNFLDNWEYEGLSDILFLAGRDGTHFSLPCREAFLRPGRDMENWHERSIFIAPWVVDTADDEMSLYSVQHYRTASVHIRRLTLRTDGFVSLHANGAAGSVLTRLLTFDGEHLEINYATSAAGSLRIAILDENGAPIPGFSLHDCNEIFGDEITRVVSWKNGANVGTLAGQVVRLRFALEEADLFSFRFFA